MKNYFKILTTILALMAVFLMPEMGWGQTQYTLTIDKSYFNTTSYAANNGDHTTVAYKVGDQSTTKSITWTSNQIMLQTDLMQWQKNNGYIYNKTDLGTINSVTVNSSAGSFTTYYGTSEHPTSGTTVGNGFFTTQVGNATGKTSSIVITFTIGSSSYTITPQSNNTSYGTVSLSGNTITATPNTGYRVSTSTPYNVSPSGSATVAQNGNIFTVTPSANTTVTINFEAIPTYTVTFNVGNGTFDGNTDFPSTSNTVAAGTYTLPSATPSSLCSTNGWNFAGWSTASVNETTTAPAILTGSYTLSDNASLYAVYSVAEGGGGNTNTSNVFSSGTFSNDVITWAISGVVTVKQERNGSGNTAPNSSYVSAPRWYSGNLITITPSVSINSITIEANTENYATALRNSTYTNASASVTGTTVTITPTNGSNPITIEMGAQSRLSSMIVNYSSGTTTYATSPSCASLLSTSVNINSSGITNTDVYSGTAAGLLSATVTETESGDPVSGATVTWTSSDEGVATINASGVVTLVAAGTTTITASYAGVANQYQASSATYTLTVTDSNPAQIYHYDFQGANNFYTDAALTTHPSYASGNNVGTIYYGDGSVFVASGDNRYFSTANLGTGYFLLGKTGAEISLPTFAGYKITQVKLHSSSGHSTNVSVSIVSGSNTASVAQTWSTKDHEYVYNIASDYQTSPLSVKVTNDYNTQFTGIDIVCEASTDPIIYASDVNLAYTATSGSINYTITNPVTGANLSASTGDWLTVGNFDTEHNILYLSCTANTTAMVRTAIVTFNYMYGGNVIATKEVTVTQEADPNALHNISDITAVGTYKVRGTIVAKSTIGFVVGDGTGYIYYYKGSEPSNNIGDMVKLEGPVVVYGGVFEFNNQATITAATESNYHTEDPMVLSGSILDATLASSETHLSYFVQYQGTLVVDPGKATHYNITDIDGAETAEGSISYPINTDFASLDGKEVIVTGYYVGKSGNKYINTMLGTIERNCDGTTVTITPSITNTDVYTGTSAGSLSATVTETEGGNAVSGATVTWTSSNTSVATVDASGNVTLVAAGTTTITASYAGVANTYCESSATYELIVTDSSPVCNIDGTITFGNGNNGTISINSANVTGDDSLDNSWTITTEGTTSFTPNADYSQVGSSSKPATSITFTTTLPSSVKISGFSAKFGGFNGTVGDVTLKVGNNVVGTGSLNGTNDVIVVNNMEAEGNTLTVLVENIDKGVICYYISYSSTAVSAPTFSLPSGGYVGEQYVSIACETPDATIHYTTDGSNPTESSSVYSSPITVGTGVTTLKAIAYTEDCESAISEATYTICASVPNAPVITISGDECDNPRTVTITGDGGVTIYYTTDNSYPTTESTVYSSPFNLTATTTVRAIAVDNGCPSNEAFEICTITPLSGDYEKVTSNLVDWSGEYVIAHSGTGDTKVLSGCNSYGTSTSYGTSEAFGTISNVLASSYVDSYKVIIEKVGETSTYTIKQGNYYLCYTGGGNYLEFYPDITGYSEGEARWTITWNGLHTVVANVAASDRQIMYNLSYERFACYTGTQDPIDLFKKVAGTAELSVVAGDHIKQVWINNNEELTHISNAAICSDATFSAEVAPGYTFLGWYDGDVLVSTDINYTFPVHGSVTYTAKAGNSVLLTAIAETPGISEVWINDGPHGTTATATVAAGSTVTFHALLSDPDNLVLNGWFGVDEHRVSSNIDFQFIVPNNTASLTYTAVAQSIQLWTNVVNEEPDSWKGIVNNTLEITCEEDLAWLISYVNGFNEEDPHDMSGQTVVVTAPIIDMFEHIWVPIGYNEVHPFKGTFDGGCNLLSGIHTDARSNELSYVENYVEEEYGEGKGTMKYAGMFGYTENATIKNTSMLFGGDDWDDCHRDWMTCSYEGGCLGALVGKGVNLNMERCYAVMGIGAFGSINSVGGLVGKAEKTDGGNHAIKACIANGHFSVLESSYTVTNLGGIVGSCNYAVTDCFAIPVDLHVKYNSENPMPVTNKGAVVGSGTATSNVYAHPYATAGFSKIDGTGTANNWYALTGLGYDNVTTFSPTLEREYGNYSSNNTIDGVPFADVLNQNVTTGYKWVTPPTKFVNGGYPLIVSVKENDTVNAVFCNQSKAQHMMLLFSHELNSLANIVFVMMGDDDDDDDGDKTPIKADSDYDDNIAFYIYGDGKINLAVPAEANMFIDEKAAVTQGVSDDVYATVGITLDNSEGNGTQYRDWHMFSSAIEEGKIGIKYESQPDGYPQSENDLTFGTHYSLVQNNAAVYFPDGINAGNQFDIYSYFEPEYHWINLKRTNHWHQDNTNGITYTGSDNADGASFTPGKGYLVALGNNSTADNNFMQAQGVLNNAPEGSEIKMDVTSTENSLLKGYNLLGNPFQSYLDFAEFANENAEVLWDGGGQGYKAYLVYDAAIDGFRQYLADDSDESYSFGAADVTGRYINMHQGFFVLKNTTSASAKVKFTNDMRSIDGNGAVFRDAQPTYPLVNLFCTDSDGKHETAIMEFERPSNAGALKMKGILNGKGQLYIHWNNDDLGSVFIDYMPEFVPVWFDAVEDGVFTLTWSTANHDFGYMHLIDNMTGADIDCLANDSYTFEAHVTDMSARFRLVFSALGIGEEPTEQAENFAFINGNELVVNGTGELSLLDLNGRVITTQYMAGEQNFMTLPTVAEGMYLLRLTKANDVKVQKIVIRK